MKQLGKEQIENLPEWMPVEGFPNYEVNCRKGLIRNARTFRILKQSLSNGYPSVRLFKDGKVWLKNVHRLVALAAFGYYDIQTGSLFVCHLDEERNDPRIVNLALGTQKENLSSPKAKQRKSEAQKGKRLSIETIKKLSKRVAAYKNGELIMVFQSTADAHRNGFNNGAVSSCCNGRLKTYKGYQWRYFDTTTAITAS